ncbi:MAG: hypothetical protein ACKVT0_03195 [Planctomycetaceae bacterium]
MAPETLDGAVVLSYAIAAESFGKAEHPEGSVDEILYLAIAKYDDAQGYYLFACNKSWEVVGDLFYNNADDAIKDAERVYETSPIQWTPIA